MLASGSVRDVLDSFDVEVLDSARDVVALDRFPNAEERQVLQGRARDLAGKLRPLAMASAEKMSAGKALAVLFGGYPALRATDVDDLISSFLLTLQELPLFGLVEACRRIAHNEAPGVSLAHAPNVTQIRRIADDVLAPLRLEQRDIARVLRSTQLMRPEVSPAERERVSAALSELGERLSVSDQLASDRLRSRVFEDQVRRQEQEILREYERLGAEPQYAGSALVSPQLLAKLGRPIKPGKKPAGKR